MKNDLVNDTISRQAALDALGERPTVWTDDDDYALGERNQYDMDRLAIETVPSAQPECADCIKNGGDYECDHVHCHKGRPAQQIPWDANTRNSMVFTLRKIAAHGDMDAIDEDNIKRLSRWLEGENHE